jgi:predicted ATPase/DNA-binding winged helix-turn-helix (wHTH) protein
VLAKTPLVYEAGSWEIDIVRRELRSRGAPVAIGSRAFDIVEKLVEFAGELVTKDALLAHAWPGLNVEENTLQVHIAAIRRAFGADRGMLKTASGRGYRLTGDWRIRNSDGSGLTADRSPARVGNPPTNLPSRVTNLVGRAAATKLLRDLLSAYRVVTLTGPGGIGKTALATEVARGTLVDFADGSWLIELAVLTDPGLVTSAVAAAVGLQLGGETISPEAIARAVGGRSLLLILDNCEHVIDATADLVEAIILHCPNVTVLATSREVLKIAGECVYRVPPLDIPSSDVEDAERLLERSAVELFVTRTQAIDAEFSPRADILPSIAAICRHLDGIPLAIEFAAARAATLGAHHVALGLSNRFELLTARRRTALPRHQTLRAALDWSYTLLSTPEQRLLRHLAVFVGGFSLDAVVAVAAAAEGSGAADDIANLVAKSLVVFDGTSSPNRWRLLETIRAYALQHLTDAGELIAAARRHAQYFRDMMVPVATNSMGRLSGEDVARFSRELDNARAAIDWSFSPSGDPATGAALTAAYASIWLRMYLVGECRDRVERMIEVQGPGLALAPALEWQMLIAYSTALITTLAPVDTAYAAVAKAQQLARGIDDIEAQMHQLWAQWSVEMVSGDYRSSLITVQRLAEIARRSGEDSIKLRADRYLSSSLLDAGRLVEARMCLERLTDHYAATGHRHHSGQFQHDQNLIARARLARVLCLRGCLDQASEQAHLTFDEIHTSDARSTLWWVLQDGLCPIALIIGDLPAAERAVTAMTEWAARIDAELWKALVPSWRGALHIARGEFEQGVGLVRRSLEVCERTGWKIRRAQSLGSLAQGLAGLGRLNEAQDVIEQAITRADRFGESWCQPELFRIKGELLLQRDRARHAVAEGCFKQGLDLAREQGSLFWELRIVLSLARLKLSHNHQIEAREMLAPVYQRFTEGFATQDLAAARAILDAFPKS